MSGMQSTKRRATPEQVEGGWVGNPASATPLRTASTIVHRIKPVKNELGITGNIITIGLESQDGHRLISVVAVK